MNQSQPEMSEEEQFLYDNNPKYTPKQVRVMLAEARTAEQERTITDLREILNEKGMDDEWRVSEMEAMLSLRERELTD